MDVSNSSGIIFQGHVQDPGLDIPLFSHDVSAETIAKYPKRQKSCSREVAALRRECCLILSQVLKERGQQHVVDTLFLNPLSQPIWCMFVFQIFFQDSVETLFPRVRQSQPLQTFCGITPQNQPSIVLYQEFETWLWKNPGLVVSVLDRAVTEFAVEKL